MAQLTANTHVAAFQPPKSLNISATNLAEEWKNWSQRFDIFITATEASKKPEPVQLAMFLSSIGDDALKVYNTFEYTDDEDKDKLATIRQKFSNYFSPRKNVVFERYQFWRLSQSQGEPIDSFVTKLRLQAQSCEFATQEESLIRDRIVWGCPDARLQERLLREVDLTLGKTLALCRAAESTQQQLRSIKTGGDLMATSSLASVASVVSNNQQQSSKGRGRSKCGNCGLTHQPKACPAYGKECNSCHKKNHFAKCCRSSSSDYNKSHQRQRTVNGTENATGQTTVYEVMNEQLNTLYVGELTISVNALSADQATSWWKTVLINGVEVQCKLDTGAEANVISVGTLQSLSKICKPAIQSTSTVLTAYNNNKIKPAGTVNLPVLHKGCTYDLEFFVVSHDASTILGLPSCRVLDIVRRVDHISTSQSTTDILNDFKDVFSGLGCYPGKHHIVLDNKAIPVVHAPRRVPLALHAKLKDSLDSLVSTGILVKRDDPTDWVNSLVLVEKKNGSLRLCLDPFQLNKYIKREQYVIPTCEDVIAKLHGKKLFTVIDMKDSFWQVQLDEPSSRLCTFNTPFGRYSFTRLPFGISSAPEILQKKFAVVW
jgi:hypothetical protein